MEGVAIVILSAIAEFLVIINNIADPHIQSCSICGTKSKEYRLPSNNRETELTLAYLTSMNKSLWDQLIRNNRSHS
jgi:hypothetical protein